MSLPLELLIAVSCISGDGCTEATKAYYAARPEFRHNIRAYRRNLEESVGREFMWAAPVIYNTTIRQRINMRLSKHLNLTVEKYECRLKFEYTF
jgi:hypothetical protein